MNSKISQQEAAAATLQIVNLCGPVQAPDPRAFMAALTAMFMAFPRAVVEKAIDPVIGIPAKINYLNLAAIRSLLDEFNADQIRFERLTAPAPKQIEAPRDPEADARMAEKFKQLSARLAGGLTESKPDPLQAGRAS